MKNPRHDSLQGMSGSQMPAMQIAYGAQRHYSDVIMSTMASQITSLTIVFSIVYSAADQKSQSAALLAFVKGIQLWPVNSRTKVQ